MTKLLVDVCKDVGMDIISLRATVTSVRNIAPDVLIVIIVPAVTMGTMGITVRLVVHRGVKTDSVINSWEHALTVV